MVYKISWESGWLPWQPRVVAMATKLGPKIALISSLQEIGKFIACTVGISGLMNFNTLSEFLRKPKKLPWQPNSEKYKPKLHKFLFLAKIEEFFACSVGFHGL